MGQQEPNAHEVHRDTRLRSLLCQIVGFIGSSVESTLWTIDFPVVGTPCVSAPALALGLSLFPRSLLTAHPTKTSLWWIELCNALRPGTPSTIRFRLTWSKLVGLCCYFSRACCRATP